MASGWLGKSHGTLLKNYLVKNYLGTRLRSGLGTEHAELAS
jgi:hypothetical protein